MTTLTVWKFDSEGGARNALQVLERLQKQELIQIVDGAIVTWAPDRKKPGLNPSDTGPFEGKAGAQPENFRWEIESARGYPPR